MKHKNIRFIFLNEAFHFYDPMISNFRCFVILRLTFENKSRNEKVVYPFQLFKNQHLEKMLVFFCIKIKGFIKFLKYTVKQRFHKHFIVDIVCNSFLKYQLNNQ